LVVLFPDSTLAGRYPNATTWMDQEGVLGDLAVKLQYLDEICVMMHPSRHSVVLFAMDKDSTNLRSKTSIADLEGANWIPEVHVLAEMATAALGSTTIVARNMDVIQQNIFGMGFGPMPFYRRCSVAVLVDEEREDGIETIITQRVSCIVPHQDARHGCRHSAVHDCYFCPYNPFYEILSDSTQPSVRYSPSLVTKLVMPIGTLLLLDTRCDAFRKLVQPWQLSRLSKKRKRAVVTYDMLGNPVPSVGDDAVDVPMNSPFIQVTSSLPPFSNVSFIQEL
jgi:hypothetical protein